MAPSPLTRPRHMPACEGCAVPRVMGYPRGGDHRRGRVEMRPFRIIAAAAIAVLWTASAQAEPLVIYGPGSPSSDLASQALKEVQSAYGVRIGIDRLVHVNEAPFPAAVPLWIMGDAEVLPCRGASITADELRELLAEARESEGTLEYKEAANVLEDATAALSCSGEVIEAELLWRLFFTRGAIAQFDGRTGEAQDNFRRALGIDPDHRFDKSYPPDVQAPYLNAREELQLSGQGSLRFSGAHEGTTQIWLDGLPLVASADFDTALNSGYHLLQYTTRLEVFYSLAFHVKSDQEAILISRSGYTWAILEGDADPRAEVIARQALRQLPGVGDSKIYVVSMDERASVYAFDPSAETFERSGTRIASRITTPPANGGGGGASSSSGGGGSGSGSGSGGSSRTGSSRTPVKAPSGDAPRLGIEAGGGPMFAIFPGVGTNVFGAVKIAVVPRIVAGLHIDGGFTLGIRSKGDGVVTIFPVGRIGARYAFTDTMIRPFAGVQFLIGGGSSASGPDAGFLASGGAMLELGEPRRLRITAELSGGHLSAGLFLFTVSAGPVF